MSSPVPAELIEVATGRRHPLGAADLFVVGRDESADVCVLYTTMSRKHFSILRDGGRYFVEGLAPHNPVLLDGQPVVGRAPLPHNAVLRAGEHDFRFECPTPVASSRVVSVAHPVAPPPSSQGFSTVMGTASDSDGVRPFKGRFRVNGRMLLGRDAGVDIPLPHPQVSRQHAEIDEKGGRVSIRDLGSANGTFVNGRRLAGRAVWLADDDLINVGPYTLRYADGELVSGLGDDDDLALELIADRVSRIVTDRQTGKKLKLLDDITLVFKPKEFVCLLGPSGSGKSTLMTILSGRGLPDQGAVLVNGQDLHANFDALKQDLALVPQKDVLHDALTVGQALGYTSRLRLPPDTSPAEKEDCIAHILNTVGLTHRRGIVIRMLSGGQVKRACLANEILCQPNLLFLDEVTSGLDELTDSEMMDLFRQIAHDGKTVVCITHSLTNVERTCDLLVLLTPGGKLAFVGSPAEARAYFHIDRLGEVYNLLDPKAPAPLPGPWQAKFQASEWWDDAFHGHGWDDLDLKEKEGLKRKLKEALAFFWQDQFLESEYYARYVTDRLPRRDRRKAESVEQPRRSVGEWAGQFVRQAFVLTGRYFALWRRDLSSLMAMGGQSLVVALLLAVVFGDVGSMPTDPSSEEKEVAQLLARAGKPPAAGEKKEANRAEREKAARTVNLLFLLAVSSFWFGCNNAAKEIVKERTIFVRECDFNLKPGSYYLSKLVVLWGFSFIQVALLFGVTSAVCHPPGNAVGQLVLLLTLSAAGTALGLLISTLAPSEEMAITLIPMVIIPQIILSGVIAPLSGLGKGLALAAVTTYWGKQGMDALLPSDIADAARASKVAEDGSFAVALLVLVAHTLAFIAATLVVMTLRGRSAAMKLHTLRKAITRV